ncbi:nucleotidyltransferase domain-containing protein [Aggregatibacter actinomycetemcomitans]|nr:nucleotidyltransferase domain-containing protein [Aggregatibacter actinomycetemcomitans]
MLTITEQELQIVKAILHQHVPNHSVWAFGSRVKGNAKTYSDLDLAIIGESPLSLNTLANLTEAFSESDLPWKVDIVDWAVTNDAFKQIILQCFEVIQ